MASCVSLSQGRLGAFTSPRTEAAEGSRTNVPEVDVVVSRHGLLPCHHMIRHKGYRRHTSLIERHALAYVTSLYNWSRHHSTRNNFRKSDTGLRGTMHYDIFRSITRLQTVLLHSIHFKHQFRILQYIIFVYTN